jgi:benzaldehyde dehydrogenase (NAD)
MHRQARKEADTAVVSATSATPRGRGPGVFDRRSGVANLVTNDPADAADVVEALITHPAVRVVNFTGSTAVGRIIAEKAGRHLKRCVLEFDGKAPFVVLADADLEAAAAAASFGAFMNQGQICMSTERIIVDASVAEEFTRLLAERAAALVVGDPGDPGTQIGPMVHAKAVSHVSDLVRDAIGTELRWITTSAQERQYPI